VLCGFIDKTASQKPPINSLCFWSARKACETAKARNTLTCPARRSSTRGGKRIIDPVSSKRLGEFRPAYSKDSSQTLIARNAEIINASIIKLVGDKYPNGAKGK
jgi:hypothetical protein